jgi:voltage-gated potassium channel
MAGTPTLLRLAGLGGSGSTTITARRAALAIGVMTVFVTVVSGILMVWIDSKDFDTRWQGLWWAVQTVTTVGYGDAVPTTGAGQALAALVMLTGIGFLAVVTAAITAAFIESARKRFAEMGSDPLEDAQADTMARQVEEILTRLERVESLLEKRAT